MLKNIIYKEIQELMISTKMLIAASIIILMMIANGVIFNIQYSNKLNKFDRERIVSVDAIRTKSSSLWSLLYHHQKFLKPPSKLAFISDAEERLLPNGLWIDYFEESQPEFYKGQNRYFSRFNSIDWSFIMIYVISFICIAFSYSAFSGEKVKGTLRLMMSNSISRGSLIFGKFIGIVVCITMPLIIGMLLDLIIIQLFSNVMFKGADLWVVFIFAITALLFISFNVLLGFFVSCLTMKPIHSLNIVLILWILLTIIVPSVSWIFSKKIVDVPSEANITKYASDTAREENRKGGYSWSWRSRWEGQPPNEQVKSRAEGINVLTNVQQEIMQNYLQDKFRQTELAIRLSKISPFSAFRFIGERLSDNGFRGFLNFHRQVKMYHTTFNDFIFQKDQQDPDSYHLFWNESWASKTFSSSKPVVFEEIPKFEYRPPSISELLKNSQVDILILVLWNLVLFAGTFVAFIRYDVR